MKMMELINSLMPVLTTLTGGLIGFLSARAIWKAQESQRRRNVAQGLLLELISMEKMLTGLANVLGGPNKVRIDSPLYPPTGLYHVLQKEIFAFDQNLSRSLFQFYMRLLEAERFRSLSLTDPRYSILQEGAQATLRAAVDQLADLKALLLKETRKKNAPSLNNHPGA